MKQQEEYEFSLKMGASCMSRAMALEEESEHKAGQLYAKAAAYYAKAAAVRPISPSHGMGTSM